MTDTQLLASGSVRLVGSTLSKANPRDIDLVLTIPDELFLEQFRLSPERWAAEGQSGNWSKERFAWSDRCVRIAKRLRARIVTPKMVDFKILPASLSDYGRRVGSS